MRASRLSSTMIRGAVTIRTRPLDSAADKRKARLMVLSIDPKVIPSAPPLPVPTAAGRFTAKFGVGMLRTNGERPAVGVLLSKLPPAAATLDGKAMPVGLPVAGPKVTSPPH